MCTVVQDELSKRRVLALALASSPAGKKFREGERKPSVAELEAEAEKKMGWALEFLRHASDDYARCVPREG